ncbi:MAG: TonB-dependent receptor [Chitinophagaceae bacterium]
MTVQLNNYFKQCLTLMLLSFSVLTSNSQTIKGKVFDASTGEPLVGATVKLTGTKYSTLVRLDGSYSFSKIPAGTYKQTITYTGYKEFESANEIVVGANETKIININLQPTATELQSVTITSNGSDRDGAVRRLEKIADPILNVLSAKTLQLLPDITVANAMQRVSGVTIEKSGSGEARYPIIRGMEKRYINTLVNGIKIPSPDNKNRFIPLDLFPSELLERLEVSKSLTPSMEGDAIGGTINLVMKDAPAKKLFQANLSLGYNSILGEQAFQKFDKGSINKQSPAERNGSNYVATPQDFPLSHLSYTDKKGPVNTTLGLTFGNRFGNDKKFGYIVSGSYQNIFRGTSSDFFLPNSQPGLDNIPLFSDLQHRHYSVQSKRMGLNGKFDFHINERNKISLFNTYVRLDEFQTRIIYDTVALNSLVTNSQRSTWQYQSIYNSTLQGNHKLSNTLKLDWDLVYSIANNHMPDQAQFSHQYALVTTSLTTDKIQSMSRVWAHNSDKDYDAYFNLTKNLKLLKNPFELKVGGMFRDKHRDNFYNSYSLNPTLDEVYTNINAAVFVFPTGGGVPSVSGNNYTFKEQIGAGYVQGKWNLGKNMELLGGVRIENTKQQYETSLSKDVDARSGTIKYTDVLPSVQVKYALTKTQNLRLAYYKALARPGFAEMIPDGPDGEFFKEVGNPVNLEHTVAHNIDLRYEYFPGNADQILLGVFYKKIQDPIEISTLKTFNNNSLYLAPVNIGDATNYGFEAVVTKYFGVFGVSANYTYTQSKITNNNMILYDAATRQTKFVAESRPLQGQSNHIGNLSLIYKNPKIGLDIQGALVYTGERISFISPYLGLHYWQSPTTQIDFSFEKTIVKKLTVYGKINNITNAPYELSLHQSYNNYLKSSGSRALALQTDPDNKIFIQKDFYKTSFLFGLRFKL